MVSPCWNQDISVLYKQWNQLIPLPSMSYSEQINALTRLILLITLIVFVCTWNIRVVIVALISLCIIAKVMEWTQWRVTQEGFSTEFGVQDVDTAFVPPYASPKTITNPVTLESVLRSDFAPTTYKNPFGNVLLTDIMDNPNKKAAAPSFNPDVHDDIQQAVQKQTQKLNPDIVNTNKQLYGDLKDQYDLDNAMMRFYSMPNTRIENDQGAYGQFLYGGMYSAKEDTAEGAMMRVKDNVRYLLI